MSGRKHIAIILAFVAAAALPASSVTGFLLSRHYSRIQYEMLDTISSQVLDREPEAEESLMAVLKEYADKDTDQAGEKPVLASWGYRASDFSGISSGRLAVCAAAGLLPGIGLWLGTFWYRNRKEALRIRMLAEYLEQVQAGKAGLLPDRREDEFQSWKMRSIRRLPVYIRQRKRQSGRKTILQKTCLISRIRSKRRSRQSRCPCRQWSRKVKTGRRKG